MVDIVSEETCEHPLCLTQPQRLDIITEYHRALDMSETQWPLQTQGLRSEDIVLRVHLSVHMCA